jgi:hypothetical protein
MLVDIEAPDTLKIACQMGVEGEIANVEMYDKFLDICPRKRFKGSLYSTTRSLSKQAQSCL